MKKITITIISILLISIFTGCTSKYQTNKLPNEDKINIPEKIKEKRYYLNEEIKDEFKKYVIKEFNNGIEKKGKNKIEPSKTQSDLWNLGYEIDKKRY